MPSSLKIVVALLLYNDEEHAAETIESLLNQSYDNFRLIISDDASTDGVEELVKKYLRHDKRITYHRNEKRLGMIGNYRFAFAHAGEDVDYFAWAAGHDIYHPDWLRRMVSTLEETPQAVMAYSLTNRISNTGEAIRVDSAVFETPRMSRHERLDAFCRRAKGCGNMIYGLFRYDALKKAGVFRPVIYPDVLLLMELLTLGEFRQIAEPLWSRRHIDLFSIARQKKALFAVRPWYVNLPWQLTHGFSAFWTHVVGPKAGSLGDRLQGIYLMRMIVLRVTCRIQVTLYRRWVSCKESLVLVRNRLFSNSCERK